MTIELDHFDVHQKQLYVIIGTTIGLVTSHLTTVLRVWAKLMVVKQLGAEDWLMIVALVMSYGVAIPLFWGLTTGLGHNLVDVVGEELRNCLLSIWLIQRFQPITLFFVKTSIIVFYVRLFGNNRTFRMFAWGIWIYTLLWTIGAWLASLLECLPVSYFWNKEQTGSCVKNPLIDIGLTDGVLSCVGDIFIFSMPIPVLGKLKMNQRKKYALMAIFAIGILVLITSFVRWIALLGTAVNVTSTQVEAGVWTYLEISTGITCGNLPLLAPLFRRYLSTYRSRGTAYNYSSKNSANPHHLASHSKKSTSAKTTTIYDGFERMEESPAGSEVELQDHHRYSSGIGIEPTAPDQIHVHTQVEIKHEQSNWKQVDPTDIVPSTYAVAKTRRPMNRS